MLEWSHTSRGTSELHHWRFAQGCTSGLGDTRRESTANGSGKSERASYRLTEPRGASSGAPCVHRAPRARGVDLRSDVAIVETHPVRYCMRCVVRRPSEHSHSTVRPVTLPSAGKMTSMKPWELLAEVSAVALGRHNDLSEQH